VLDCFTLTCMTALLLLATTDEESVAGGDAATAGHTRAPANTSGAHAGGGGHGGGHGEEFEFGEVMVHQVGSLLGATHADTCSSASSVAAVRLSGE
jgi:hypothetical protein